MADVIYRRTRSGWEYEPVTDKAKDIFRIFRISFTNTGKPRKTYKFNAVSPNDWNAPVWCGITFEPIKPRENYKTLPGGYAEARQDYDAMVRRPR
jgi:hypothetical protein